MSSLEQRLQARGAYKTGGTIAALDIGCSKITCMIATRDLAGPEGFRLCGGGRQQSKGFTGGAITDMNGLERAIRLAVEDAERHAGEQIDSVVLGITGPKVRCRLVTATVTIGGREITARDSKRLLAQALIKAEEKGMETLSAHPVAWRVDEQEGVRHPEGMHCEELAVLLSVVYAPRSIVRNLVECVGRAHLGVERLVPSAMASGAGTLIDDERENGAICIDMGAGVTAVSVFLNNAPAWLGLVPVGGQHVTGDIAQGIGTTFAAAERLKTISGTADYLSPGMDELIEVPKLGDDGRLHAEKMKKGEVAAIIGPRIEEIFELVDRMLKASDVRKVLPRRAVLTGGASQLAGIRDVAQRTLQMPIRLGRPVSSVILGEILGTPAFSTAAGLLSYHLSGSSDAAFANAANGGLAGGSGPGGKVNKAFRWLKENF